MSRYILFIVLLAVMTGGCLKKGHDQEYFSFEYKYRYTICKRDDGGWPFYDTIRQLPEDKELIYRYGDKGFRFLLNGQIILQCDEYVYLYDEMPCNEVESGMEGYRICDDTIVKRGSHFYRLPMNILDNCGPCSYSVWY